MGAQAGSQTGASQCTGFNTAAAAQGHTEATAAHQPEEGLQCAQNKKGKAKKTRKGSLSLFSQAMHQFLAFSPSSFLQDVNMT